MGRIRDARTDKGLEWDGRRRKLPNIRSIHASTFTINRYVESKRFL